MNISKTCNLILSDLFEYDIVGCAYNILKSSGWDLSDIPYDDKETRNIKIGLLQRKHPKLAKYLLDTTHGIIQYYLDINHIKEQEVITRQRDGIILTKKLQDNTSSLTLELRNMISKMIITIDRKWYLSILPTGKVKVKGVPDKPLDVSFYNMFKGLNFSNKQALISGLEAIRQKIFTHDNIMWYSFERENSIYVPIIGQGDIKVTRSSLRYIDTDEINKRLVWDNYVWPFSQSILIYCNQ